MQRITLKYHANGKWTANSWRVLPHPMPPPPPARGDAAVDANESATASASSMASSLPPRLVIGRAPCDGFESANIVEIVFENAATHAVTRVQFANAVELKCARGRTLAVPQRDSSRVLSLAFLGVGRDQARLNTESRKAAYFVDKMSRSEVEERLRAMLAARPTHVSVEQLLSRTSTSYLLRPPQILLDPADTLNVADSPACSAELHPEHAELLLRNVGITNDFRPPYDFPDERLKVPSVIHLRCGPFEALVSVVKRHDEASQQPLRLRRSMSAFPMVDGAWARLAERRLFDASVVDFARPVEYGYLTQRDILMLQCCFGVDDKVFLELQENEFSQYDSILHMNYKTRNLDRENVVLHALNLVPPATTLVRPREAQRDEQHSRRRNERPAPLPVPRVVLRAQDSYRMLVVRSRMLFAVPDPFHMLRESEAFVRIMNYEGQRCAVLTCDIGVFPATRAPPPAPVSLTMPSQPPHARHHTGASGSSPPASSSSHTPADPPRHMFRASHHSEVSRRSVETSWAFPRGTHSPASPGPSHEPPAGGWLFREQYHTLRAVGVDHLDGDSRYVDLRECLVVHPATFRRLCDDANTRAPKLFVTWNARLLPPRRPAAMHAQPPALAKYSPSSSSPSESESKGDEREDMQGDDGSSNVDERVHHFAHASDLASRAETLFWKLLHRGGASQAPLARLSGVIFKGAHASRSDRGFVEHWESQLRNVSRNYLPDDSQAQQLPIWVRLHIRHDALRRFLLAEEGELRGFDDRRAEMVVDTEFGTEHIALTDAAWDSDECRALAPGDFVRFRRIVPRKSPHSTASRAYFAPRAPRRELSTEQRKAIFSASFSRTRHDDARGVTRRGFECLRQMYNDHLAAARTGIPPRLRPRSAASRRPESSHSRGTALPPLSVEMPEREDAVSLPSSGASTPRDLMAPRRLSEESASDDDDSDTAMAAVASPRSLSRVPRGGKASAAAEKGMSRLDVMLAKTEEARREKEALTRPQPLHGEEVPSPRPQRPQPPAPPNDSSSRSRPPPQRMQPSVSSSHFRHTGAPQPQRAQPSRPQRVQPQAPPSRQPQPASAQPTRDSAAASVSTPPRGDNNNPWQTVTKSRSRGKKLSRKQAPQTAAPLSQLSPRNAAPRPATPTPAANNRSFSAAASALPPPTVRSPLPPAAARQPPSMVTASPPDSWAAKLLPQRSVAAASSPPLPAATATAAASRYPSNHQHSAIFPAPQTSLPTNKREYNDMFPAPPISKPQTRQSNGEVQHPALGRSHHNGTSMNSQTQVNQRANSLQNWPSQNSAHPKAADKRLSSKAAGPFPPPSGSHSASAASSVDSHLASNRRSTLAQMQQQQRPQLLEPPQRPQPEERSMSTQTDFSDADSDTTSTTMTSASGSGSCYAAHSRIEAFRAANYHTKSVDNLTEQDIESLPPFTMANSTPRVTARVALSATAPAFLPTVASSSSTQEKVGNTALNVFAKEFSPAATAAAAAAPSSRMSASSPAPSATSLNSSNGKSLDVAAKPFVPKTNSASSASNLNASASEWTPPAVHRSGETQEASAKSSRRPSLALNVNAKAFEPGRANDVSAKASDSNGSGNVGKSSAPVKPVSALGPRDLNSRKVGAKAASSPSSPSLPKAANPTADARDGGDAMNEKENDGDRANTSAAAVVVAAASSSVGEPQPPMLSVSKKTNRRTGNAKNFGANSRHLEAPGGRENPIDLTKDDLIEDMAMKQQSVSVQKGIYSTSVASGNADSVSAAPNGSVVVDAGTEKTPTPSESEGSMNVEAQISKPVKASAEASFSLNVRATELTSSLTTAPAPAPVSDPTANSSSTVVKRSEGVATSSISDAEAVMLHIQSVGVLDVKSLNAKASEFVPRLPTASSGSASARHTRTNSLNVGAAEFKPAAAVAAAATLSHRRSLSVSAPEFKPLASSPSGSEHRRLGANAPEFVPSSVKQKESAGAKAVDADARASANASDLPDASSNASGDSDGAKASLNANALEFKPSSGEDGGNSKLNAEAEKSTPSETKEARVSLNAGAREFAPLADTTNVVKSLNAEAQEFNPTSLVTASASAASSVGGDADEAAEVIAVAEDLNGGVYYEDAFGDYVDHSGNDDRDGGDNGDSINGKKEFTAEAFRERLERSKDVDRVKEQFEKILETSSTKQALSFDDDSMIDLLRHRFDDGLTFGSSNTESNGASQSAGLKSSPEEDFVPPDTEARKFQREMNQSIIRNLANKRDGVPNRERTLDSIAGVKVEKGVVHFPPPRPNPYADLESSDNLALSRSATPALANTHRSPHTQHHTAAASLVPPSARDLTVPLMNAAVTVDAYGPASRKVSLTPMNPMLSQMSPPPAQSHPQIPGAQLKHAHPQPQPQVLFAEAMAQSQYVAAYDANAAGVPHVQYGSTAGAPVFPQPQTFPVTQSGAPTAGAPVSHIQRPQPQLQAPTGFVNALRISHFDQSAASSSSGVGSSLGSGGPPSVMSDGSVLASASSFQQPPPPQQAMPFASADSPNVAMPMQMPMPTPPLQQHSSSFMPMPSQIVHVQTQPTPPPIQTQPQMLSASSAANGVGMSSMMMSPPAPLMVMSSGANGASLMAPMVSPAASSMAASPVAPSPVGTYFFPAVTSSEFATNFQMAPMSVAGFQNGSFTPIGDASMPMLQPQPSSMSYPSTPSAMSMVVTAPVMVPQQQPVPMSSGAWPLPQQQQPPMPPQ